MKYLFLHLFFFGLSLPFLAQQMQWASELVDKSSQYGREVYSAEQVLGVPNAVNGNSTARMAWAPAREESNVGEHIHVRYGVEMRISQVVIVESKNPGAIKRITLFDDKNKRHIIYENPNPSPIKQASRYFSHTFPLTDYKVSEVLVELKTSAVVGSNQIDAIGISPNKQPYEKKLKHEAFSAKNAPTIENLGVEINSAFAERLPIISPDGKTLYFARKYHPQNRGEEDFDDIWVSYMQGGNTWSRPVNMGPPLNNNDHNFVVATSPAGDVLWLGNEYNSSKKDGISYSQRFGRTWSRPKNVRIADHYNLNPFVCYHVSVDERVLLLSVERREGLGDRDLYVSFRLENGEFSKPKSLGTTINTVGMESSVFLAADGKTIYFSSNGHEGYGGLDMFKSQRLDDSWTRWSKPTNLGQTVNTPENDYNFTIPASGDYAYFSRDDASGMSDLFRLKLEKINQPNPVIFIKGQLVDAETKKPIGGVLKYENFKKKNKANELVSDDNGNFTVVLPYGDNVEIYGEKSGYFAISEQMQLAQQIEELDDDGGNTDETLALGIQSELDGIKLELNQLERDLDALEGEPSPRHLLLSGSHEENRRNKPYTSDAKLLELQRKYEQRIGEAQPFAEETITSKKAIEEEDELAAMKRKFQEANGQKSNPSMSDRVPVISSNETEDEELVAMKRKFNRYNSEEEAEELLAKGGGVKYLEFVDLEEKTWKETEGELFAEIHKELQEELLEETKEELKSELSAKEREALSKLKPKLKELPVARPQPAGASEDNPDWVNEIKLELRSVLEQEVRLELRRELREEVREELRRELKIQVKQELEIELRKELKKKREAELLAEKNRRNSEPVSTPAASDEEVEEIAETIEPVYKEIEKEILLAPIKVGQVIPMNNVFFDSNEARIKEESYSELQRVIAFLTTNTNLIIEVGGHTNGWCSNVFANELSADRAKEVRAFFISEGIKESRIKYHGYGKTQPVATNDTKAGRRKNQRVEMKILEIL